MRFGECAKHTIGECYQFDGVAHGLQLCGQVDGLRLGPADTQSPQQYQNP
jgi:hypothetical protein